MGEIILTILYGGDSGTGVFTGKRLFQSPFLNKVAGQEHIFYRTSPRDCFCHVRSPNVYKYKILTKIFLRKWPLVTKNGCDNYFNDTLQGETVFYSTQYKNLSKQKLGCFWPFFPLRFHNQLISIQSIVTDIWKMWFIK